MHFDDLMVIIGVGPAQYVNLFCCSLLVFLEGFLPSGLFFMMPQIICEATLPTHAGTVELSTALVPYLTGLVVGTLIAMSSDVGGRRSFCVFAGAVGFWSLPFAASSPIILVFEIATFFAGVSVAGISSGCRILIFEILHMKLRGSCVVVLDIVWSLGILCSIGFAHKYIGSSIKTTAASELQGMTTLGPPWRVHLLLCAFLALFGTITAKVAAFSPRQMFAHQRVVTSHTVLRRFFSANKRDHESNFLAATGFPPEIFTYVETRQLRRNAEYIYFALGCLSTYMVGLFRCPFLSTTTVLIILHAFLFDGTILMIEAVGEVLTQGGDPILSPGSVINSSAYAALCGGNADAAPSYMAHIYLAAAVVMATALVAPVMDLCPRPIILVVSCFTGASASILLTFRLNPAVDWAAGCALIFCHSIALATLNIITMESFPTKFRATGYNLMKFVSRFVLACLPLFQNRPASHIFQAIPYGMFCACLLSMCFTNKNRKQIIE